MPDDGSVARVFITQADISERFWTFGLESGQIFARNVVFGRNGRILHYNSPNERRWRLQEGEVWLIAEDGSPSAHLKPARSPTTGRLELVGEHIVGGPSGLILAFRETGLEYPVFFHWTKAMEDFLSSKPVYLCMPYRTEGVYREGQLIELPRPAVVEPHAALPYGSFLDMGAYSYCHGSFTSGTASIGRYCSIAAGSGPFGPPHPMDRVSTGLFTYDVHYQTIAKSFGVSSYEIEPYDQSQPPVRIGHDVWVGQDATIKGGVEIGTGAVIGARSMVTRDVPPYAIVGGTPARIIRSRFEADVIDKLLASHWWTYNFCDLPRSVTDPTVFVEDLRIMVAEGTIQPWCPPTIDIGVELLRIDGEAPLD
jgi:acetyltransferase-like isoleucine patch superfamily enzyme